MYRRFKDCVGGLRTVEEGLCRSVKNHGRGLRAVEEG